MKHLFLLLDFCSLALLVVGYLNQPSAHSMTVWKGFNAGVWSQEFDSRLIFFNDDEYDPATPVTHFPGSITEKVFYLSAVPGIYYRYILTEQDTYWVCQLSLWYLIIVFGLLVIYFQLRETFYENLPGKSESEDSEETESQNRKTSWVKIMKNHWLI